MTTALWILAVMLLAITSYIDAMNRRSISKRLDILSERQNILLERLEGLDKEVTRIKKLRVENGGTGRWH